MFEYQPLGWVYLLIDTLFQNFGSQSNQVTENGVWYFYFSWIEHTDYHCLILQE